MPVPDRQPEHRQPEFRKPDRQRCSRAVRTPVVSIGFVAALAMMWLGTSHAPHEPVSWSPYVADGGVMDPDLPLPPSTASAVIESPLPGALMRACTPVSIAVGLKDPAGRAFRVDVYSGDEYLGSLPDAPWTLRWYPSEGVHRLRAVVLEDTGAWAVSTPITVHVSSTSLPAFQRSGSRAVGAEGQQGEDAGNRPVVAAGGSCGALGPVLDS